VYTLLRFLAGICTIRRKTPQSVGPGGRLDEKAVASPSGHTPDHTNRVDSFWGRHLLVNKNASFAGRTAYGPVLERIVVLQVAYVAARPQIRLLEARQNKHADDDHSDAPNNGEPES
jgi:hypothetical protein